MNVCMHTRIYIHIYTYSTGGETDWDGGFETIKKVWASTWNERAFIACCKVSSVTHMNESCHTYGLGMCRMWISHVTQMNESCHACEPLQLSRFYRLPQGESCHTYEWVMSHIWMSHVTHMWIRHGTHMEEPCHTYEWVTSRLWMSHDARMNASPAWMSHVTVASICNQRAFMADRKVSHGTHIWMSHVMRMYKSYIWCHTYEWVMSHLSMNHVTHMNESCNTYEWVMLHVWMSHVICMNESCHTYERVMSQIWMSYVTHINESCHAYEWVMSYIWTSHVTHKNESFHTYG